MWFLAWREIRHGRVRFGLTAALVGLVAFLVFMLTGLAVGLGAAGVSGVERLPGSVVVYSAGAERVLSRSALPAADRERIAAVPGVASVAPLGQSMAQVRGAHGTVSVALTGVDPGAPFAAPALASGGIVLDRTLAADARTGDTVTLQPGGLRLKVAGFADLGSIQHTAVAQVPLPVWRRTQPATPGTGVYLVGASDAAATAAAIAKAVPGTEAVTKRAAVDSVPGYAAETGTITMIRGFLLAVAALLIGTVFWIFTMQKEASLAVLRATGARARLLVGSYLLQVAATTALGIAAGFAIVLGIGSVMPAGAFSLPGGAAALSAALLAALAVTASAASLRRLLTVDPLLSLGRNA